MVWPVKFFRLKQINIWPYGGRVLHRNSGGTQGTWGKMALAQISLVSLFLYVCGSLQVCPDLMESVSRKTAIQAQDVCNQQTPLQVVSLAQLAFREVRGLGQCISPAQCHGVLLSVRHVGKKWPCLNITQLSFSLCISNTLSLSRPSPESFNKDCSESWLAAVCRFHCKV